MNKQLGVEIARSQATIAQRAEEFAKLGIAKTPEDRQIAATNMLYIQAKIVHGLGWATANLKKQIPRCAKEFPEIKGCFYGSINFRLESPLRIERPDFITSEIDWEDMKEVFHFTRIKLELLRPLPAKKGPRPVYDAWIYGPQNSPHRVDPFYLEVIAKKLDLRGVETCRIGLDRDYRKVDLTIID